MLSSGSMDGREAAITVVPGRVAPGCGWALAGGCREGRERRQAEQKNFKPKKSSSGTHDSRNGCVLGSVGLFRREEF